MVKCGVECNASTVIQVRSKIPHSKDPPKIHSRSDQDPVKIRSRSTQDPIKIQSRSDQDPVKMRSRSSQDPIKIQSRSNQDPVKIRSRPSQDLIKIQSRSDQDPIKTRSRPSQDPIKIQSRSDQDPVKTRSRPSQDPIKIQSRSDQDPINQGTVPGIQQQWLFCFICLLEPRRLLLGCVQPAHAATRELSTTSNKRAAETPPSPQKTSKSKCGIDLHLLLNDIGLDAEHCISVALADRCSPNILLVRFIVR